MAKHGNTERYEVVIPALEDLIVIYDASTGKTKNVKYGSFVNGDFEQDNTNVIMTVFAHDSEGVVDAINNFTVDGTAFGVTDKQSLIIKALITDISGLSTTVTAKYFHLINKGKGLYGAGGDTSVEESNLLEFRSDLLISIDTNESNSPVIYSLINENIDNPSVALNATDEDFEIINGTDYYFQIAKPIGVGGIYQALNDYSIYRFVGAEGIYGNISVIGNETSVPSDFVLVEDFKNGNKIYTRIYNVPVIIGGSSEGVNTIDNIADAVRSAYQNSTINISENERAKFHVKRFIAGEVRIEKYSWDRGKRNNVQSTCLVGDFHRYESETLISVLTGIPTDTFSIVTILGSDVTRPDLSLNSGEQIIIQDSVLQYFISALQGTNEEDLTAFYLFTGSQGTYGVGGTDTAVIGDFQLIEYVTADSRIKTKLSQFINDGDGDINDPFIKASDLPNTSGDVTSVNGETGAVVLEKSDIGLGNVDNTSDVNKPVSSAQQAEIDTKEDALGNPSNNGQVLSSQIDGTRSWVDQSTNTVSNENIIKNYNIVESSLPYKTSSCSITDDYIYFGEGDTVIKWDGDKTVENILTVSGATHWRCLWEHSSGSILMSPFEKGSSPTIVVNGHGLYKYDGISSTKVLSLNSVESIWGIDEDSNGNIYAGVYTLSGNNSKIYKSSDDGDTFTEVFNGAGFRHCHSIKYDSLTDTIYALLGDTSGADQNYKSTDEGLTWNTFITGKEVSQFTDIIAVEGARLLGTDQLPYGRIYRTTDDIDYEIVLNTHYQNVFFMRQSDVTGWLYAGFKLDPAATKTLRAEIYVSKDNGLTWQVYKTFQNLTISDGYWFASNFKDGKLIISSVYNGEYRDALLIEEKEVLPQKKVKEIIYPRELNDFDNNSLLLSLDNTFLKIPNDKLDENFNMDFDVVSGTFHLKTDTDVTLSESKGRSFSEGDFGKLKQRGIKNTFRVNSNEDELVNPVFDVSDLIAYYRFEGNSNSEVNSLNGVDTSISYGEDVFGSNAKFTTGSFIQVSDNDLLSFTDGVDDTPFSIQFQLRLEIINGNKSIIFKRDGTGQEYNLSINNGVVAFNLFGNSAGNRLSLSFDPSIQGLSEIITITYDGSKNASGLKGYVGKTLVQNGGSLVGTYTGTTNTNIPLLIGISGLNSAFDLRGGTLTNLSISNKELTSLEVSERVDKLMRGENLI